MIAALPMYLRPENRGAHDALWDGLRDRLRAAGLPAPDALDHAAAPEASWSDPALVLGQVCNLPWRLRFSDRLRLVALPDHRLPGTPPGCYHSVLVVRSDDPRNTAADFDGATLALNAADSQSGWGACAAWARAARIGFGAARVTGAHRASAAAVAAGAADLAALDAVTWRLMGAMGDPEVAALRVLARTPPSPALAYVTAAAHDPAPVAAALAAALGALPDATRAALGVFGLCPPDPAAYAALPVPPPPPS